MSDISVRYHRFVAPAVFVAVLAVTGCSGPGEDTEPASVTSTATPTAPAGAPTPNVSPISGFDACAVVTPEEVATALGRQDLVPERTTDENDGAVVAESCNWGSEEEGFFSIGWMQGPIPAWGEDEQSRAFTEALGGQITLNQWGGNGCTAYTPGRGTNLGVNIVPSEQYLAEEPPVPGNDVCDRNKATIIAAFDRALA